MPDNQKNDNMMQQVDSQFRRTYSPTYAWADCIAAYSMMLGLRGLWPMSTVFTSANAIDHSHNARTLTANGTPVYRSTGITQYADYDGANDWHARADEAAMDILGNEAYIGGGQRGMTVGGWFRFGILGSVDTLIAKSNGVAQQSFLLVKSALNVITMNIYAAGGGGGAVTVGAGTVLADTWYFFAGRFNPSIELALFTDGVKETNAAGLPATIFNSTADFTIGAMSGGINKLAGRAALCFYSAARLSDTEILSLYHISRPLFGK